jgi:hypothetical protein
VDQRRARSQQNFERLQPLARLMLLPSSTIGARRVRGDSLQKFPFFNQCRDARPPPARCSKEGSMDADSRRRVEMGARALEFSRAHPDSEPGATEVVARLEQLIARANDTAAAQRNGVIQVRAAAAQKEKLRRAMQVPIGHLAEVGRAAAREEHELGKLFRFRPGAETHLAFRTAARSMAAAAQERREVLVKYGLSPSVLDGFVAQLDQFDEAVVLGRSLSSLRSNSRVSGLLDM